MSTPTSPLPLTDLPALHQTAESFTKYTYDFIICGGGTAGLVVAARLTEDPDIVVGVLEAGNSKLGDPIVDSPVTFVQTYNNPEYDWMIKTVPQEGNVNRRHHIPRGKALGGSSAINYMMYVRGSLQDYDDWAIIADDESWNAENMMKYMRKHQTLEPIPDSVTERKTMPFVGENHGTSGPVRTSFNDFRLRIEDDFINACDEVCGMSNKPIDPFSGDHIGFYNTLGTVIRNGPDKGKRSYAARGYFQPNAHRPNLHVLCDATVTAIALEGNKAVGVNFVHGKDRYTVAVNKEVIVSAGAIHSPAILELSGIGNPEVLRKAGVELKIANEAVGENFMDHLLTFGCWELEPNVMTLESIQKPEGLKAAMKHLQKTGGGPLTSICTTHGFFPYKLFATAEEQDRIIKSIEADLDRVTPFQRKQLIRTIEHLKDDRSANLQIVFIPSTFGMVEGIEDQSKVLPPPKSADQPLGMTVCLGLQYPISRGTVHITSADSFAAPAVDPGFLKHQADVDVLSAGLKMLGKVEKNKHMAHKITKRVFPNAGVDMDSTEQLRESVRQLVMSEYHIAGSVAMGDATDSKLLVKGTQNIRVIDASIFPNHVSGNIVSSVYALAEKGADIIKEKWSHGNSDKATTNAKL